jgi:membrane protease YdiL (CAAX protease family)
MKMRPANWIRSSPLVAYFVLVFGIEWLLVLILPAFVPAMIALLIGSWLPDAVGLLVTGVAGGRGALRKLFDKVLLWRIPLRWFAIALLLPVALTLLTIGIYTLLGNAMPVFAPASQLLPIVLVSVFTGALGEELGWRGTALPRLQSRWTPLISSLILGPLWGLYHLPALLLSGFPQQDLPIVPFIVASLALTILVTWTFNHTRGSLIPVFLYHFSFNLMLNLTGIIRIPGLFSLLAGLSSVVAFAVIALDWRRFSTLAAGSPDDVWTIG